MTVRCVISHHTVYSYSRPVFLEPHVIRLRPRCEPGLELVDFKMVISPEPAGSSSGMDAEGNAFCQCWFEQETRSLEIRTWAEVVTWRTNPFDFVLDHTSMQLPPALPKHLQSSLAPCLQRAYPQAAGERDQVADLQRSLQQQANHATLEFCTLLCGYIFSTMDKIVRQESGVQPPMETLQKQSGSCRDLAVLYIEVARAAGLAARFVSGYFWPATAENEEPSHELHAWAEIYMPGGGWRGFDPSQGLATADRHIPLAAAAGPAEAAPVSGTFRGTGASSSLSHEVELRCSSA